MKKVVIGMSGGVDSSIAAAILKEEGYQVIGLFMRNWHEEDGSGICTAESDFQDVKNVCGILDIPYYSVDFSREYQERVFRLFLDEYKRGRTPNPDVLCNKEIKFDAFVAHAKKIGADFVATGHYCGTRKIGGRIWLARAKDENKDQTYFLNQLSEKQLENVIFPLGDLTKPEVRVLASKYNFSTAEKKDSTGICFIGERDFRKFLAEYLPMKQGDIKTLDGKVIGEHNGAFYYTVGQRKNLGIGGGFGETGKPWFVISKDVKNNVLYVGEGDDCKELYSTELITETFNFITETFNFITETYENAEFECLCRIRHRQPLQSVKAYAQSDGRMRIVFENPVRGVADGQYAVLYQDRLCIGGGVIAEKK